MTYQQPDTISRTGDWLVDTVRRKPEALLLMAAGCALLMRSGRRRPVGSIAAGMAASNQSRRGWSPGGSPSSGLGESLGRAADTVSGYAGEVADKVSGTAKTYASTVADTVSDYADTARRTASDYAEGARRSATSFAEDARRNVSETSERLMAQAGSTYQTAADAIREQPILVAALGLATGAAVAALFPATDVERRALGGASDALVAAAGEAKDKLVNAAGAAGDRLKDSLADRKLDSEGLKDMARDVAGSFADAASGTSEPDRNAAGRGTPSSDAAARGRSSGSTAVPGSQSPSGSASSVTGRAPGTVRDGEAKVTAERSAGNVPGRT